MHVLEPNMQEDAAYIKHASSFSRPKKKIQRAIDSPAFMMSYFHCMTFV